jgi:ADP-heptose:LPS heptosyltransferase
VTTPGQTATRLVQEAGRVLVVRVDDLGDNVMASGFPGAVARSIPGVCGFIGPPAAVEIMDVDGLGFVAGVDCRPRRQRDVLTAGRRLRAEIARFAPDVVLLPRFGFEREALGVALVGPRPARTVTWVRDATPKRQRRDWWLSLLPGPRIPATGVPLHEFERLQHFARTIGVDPTDIGPALTVEEGPVPRLSGVTGPLVAVAIGAAQGRRWWPLERYAAVIGALGESGYTTVLLGSPEETDRGRSLRDQLAKGAPVVDLIGRIPLRETVAVIDRCALFVGNDSGLGHVAGAVGTPAVIVSCHPVGAPADHVNAPERYRPVGGPSVVVRPASPTSADCADGCVPADEPCCITRVPVEDVLDACRTLLTDPGPVVGHGADSGNADGGGGAG